MLRRSRAQGSGFGVQSEGRGLSVGALLLFLVVQYLGVLKVNLWEYKGNVFTQKG